MAHKTMVGGTAYEISGGKALVGGTAYSIKGGKTLVDGTGYEIGFGTKIGDLPVGSSVYIKTRPNSSYDWRATEFIVIHQGNPDASKYSSECNGTWLLRNSSATTKNWGTGTHEGYNDSEVHSLLSDSTGSIRADMDSSIFSNKISRFPAIPYCNRIGTVYDGFSNTANQVNAIYSYLFLLSAFEVGFTSSDNSYLPPDKEGSCLDYFKNKSNHFNIGWLRSPSIRTSGSYMDGYAFVLRSSGNLERFSVSTYMNVTPALILRSETLVDSSFNVKA